MTKEEPPITSPPEQVGLDGYWERRARVEGLRLIVGQRLELGNPFGWQGKDDPLYPPNSTTLTNLARQRRTLRDNLAAVQSTLIYHYANDKDFPVATLATTVHPGTAKSLERSTYFEPLPYKYKNVDLAVPDPAEKDHVNTNFLAGDGTNGWEFNPPGNVTNQADFAKLIEDENNPLRIALNNLAYFAGDSNGAFPPQKKLSTDPNNPVTHPYPEYTMWGNFSELRQVLIEPSGGVKKNLKYSDVSIADRTTVQTAAATIGLLAYNLDNLKRQYQGLTTDSNQTTSGMKALATYFAQLIDGDVTNGEVNNLISPKVPFPKNYDASTDAANFYGQFTPDNYIEAFSKMPAVTRLTRDKQNELIAKARLLASYIQIERDRLLGFRLGYMASPFLLRLVPGDKTEWEKLFITRNSSDDGNIQPITNTKLIIGSNDPNGIVLGESPSNNSPNQVGNGLNTSRIGSTSNPNQRVIYNTVCDPDIFTRKPNGTKLPLTNTELSGLSVAFCPKNLAPKYPSLYFIFPKYRHNYLGDWTGAENLYGPADDQPVAANPSTTTRQSSEEYIDDTYLAYDRNVNLEFLVLKPVSIGSFPLPVSDNVYDAENSLASIALQPRDLSDWKLPKITSTSDPNPTGNTGDRINRIVYKDSSSVQSFVRLPFLDKAFYDGRQLMQIRALNIDLKMLKNNSLGNDTWLTKSGIIYAFREDAIREDEIARPTGSTFANCNTEAKITTNAACQMKVSNAIPQDPPNNSSTEVSLKPVDFYSDPDRRPYGFRLVNGSDISRSGTRRGFSFISDNPIYIQGNLNLHQDSSGKAIEEFTELLDSNWSNFYTRQKLNKNFAKEASDRWRAVEILGDALTVLSNNFCDGVVEDGFINTDPNCLSNSTSSYRNSTLANETNTNWLRENAVDQTSPITVNRNAQISRANGTFDYRSLSDNKTLNEAIDTRMNAIFISGLVPSRAGQSYGGFHNFPRFIENWSDKKLDIAGAFIQLNFSTYATAPWDQEAWEPGSSPASGESIRFYSPPERRWGYDVALQYSPPGPIASRFVSSGSPRNEFYRQLSADDPYTKLLRCVTVKGKKIDPKATDCPP